MTPAERERERIRRGGLLVADRKIRVDAQVTAPAFSALVDGSAPNTTYHVTHGPMLGWRCPCPDWTRRRRDCKHILGCKAWLVDDGQDLADYWDDEEGTR